MPGHNGILSKGICTAQFAGYQACLRCFRANTQGPAFGSGGMRSAAGGFQGAGPGSGLGGAQMGAYGGGSVRPGAARGGVHAPQQQVYCCSLAVVHPDMCSRSWQVRAAIASCLQLSRDAGP